MKHKNKVWKLFKVKNEDTRRRQWRRSSFFIVTCEHVSNFVLIVDFEQATVCWVSIKKMNTFENKIGYMKCYVVAF